MFLVHRLPVLAIFGICKLELCTSFFTSLSVDTDTVPFLGVSQGVLG